MSPLLGCQLGYAQAFSGRIHEGLSLLEEARHESKSTGRPGDVIWVQEMLAQVYLLCGRERDAAATARDALDASRRVRRRGGEALPLETSTLGLFTIVINALHAAFEQVIAQGLGLGFRVDKFLAALLGALIISVVSLVLRRSTSRPRWRRDRVATAIS